MELPRLNAQLGPQDQLFIGDQPAVLAFYPIVLLVIGDVEDLLAKRDVCPDAPRARIVLVKLGVRAHNRTAGIDDQKVRDFFDNDYILLINLDKQVGDLARRLMLAGHAGLKPPDAIHLATACIAKLDEFHTFDDRLLALDGQIDKTDATRLVIKKPSVPAPPAPLLDEIERGQGRK